MIKSAQARNGCPNTSVIIVKISRLSAIHVSGMEVGRRLQSPTLWTELDENNNDLDTVIR